MSYEMCSFSSRQGIGCGYCLGSQTLKGSRAYIVIIQGLIVVMRFLAVKGPSGTYSHVCRSLADQSFSSTKPNIYSLAQFTLIGVPSQFNAPPRKAPIYTQKSNLLLQVNDGVFAVGALVCPRGLRTSLSTWIDELRPWQPTGKCNQFSCRAFQGPRMILPTLKAWLRDEQKSVQSPIWQGSFDLTVLISWTQSRWGDFTISYWRVHRTYFQWALLNAMNWFSVSPWKTRRPFINGPEKSWSASALARLMTQSPQRVAGKAASSP